MRTRRAGCGERSRSKESRGTGLSSVSRRPFSDPCFLANEWERHGFKGSDIRELFPQSPHSRRPVQRRFHSVSSSDTRNVSPLCSLCRVVNGLHRTLDGRAYALCVRGTRGRPGANVIGSAVHEKKRYIERQNGQRTTRGDPTPDGHASKSDKGRACRPSAGLTGHHDRHRQ